MEYTVLLLLFYCSLQVSAEHSTLDVNAQYQQDLERDRKKCAENAHRLNEQYLAHFSTLDLALRIIDISLPVFEQREQELENEIAKSRQLQTSLQEKLLQHQNFTKEDDEKNLEEEMSIEEKISRIKLQIVQIETDLRVLKLEKEYISMNNKVVLDKQTELETSLTDLQSFGAPLENIETHLTKQLEQAQELLRTERKMNNLHLQTTSKFMELKLKYIESLNNFTISNLNSRIEYGNQKLNETLEQNLMLSSELKSAKNNELQLVLANNLTISRLNTAIDTEKEKHKDEKRNLLTQLEIVLENERRLHSANNATLNNLTACNEAAKREQEEAINQVENLDSKLSAALENVTILLSSLNETTATNVINEQNLVTCYNSYNTCSVKEAESLQRNKNITEQLKNCEISNSNSSTQNIKLNLVLLYQNTTRNAEDLQRKLASTNSSLSNLLEEYAILKKRNSGLAELNTNLTKADLVTRGQSIAFNLKINEMDRNITLKIDEIYELLKNNSNWILSNQNTTKNAEYLQQKVTSMNFSLSNFMNEIEKLKENNSNLILSNQKTEKNAEDLQQKITSMKLSLSILKNEIAKLKEELNKDINAKVDYYDTPLIRAARDNQTSTVRALIDLGANLDLQGESDSTALTFAADRNNTGIVKMLLDAGADVNIRNTGGWSALIIAARRNNIEVVKMLLAKGAQVNLAHNYGYTALHYAAWEGNVEVAKFLVGYGANINVKNNSGYTPLKLALKYNRTEVANYLKSVGATE